VEKSGENNSYSVDNIRRRKVINQNRDIHQVIPAVIHRLDKAFIQKSTDTTNNTKY